MVALLVPALLFGALIVLAMYHVDGARRRKPTVGEFVGEAASVEEVPPVTTLS
jgi:hypothetical protein